MSFYPHVSLDHLLGAYVPYIIREKQIKRSTGFISLRFEDAFYSHENIFFLVL